MANDKDKEKLDRVAPAVRSFCIVAFIVFSFMLLRSTTRPQEVSVAASHGSASQESDDNSQQTIDMLPTDDLQIPLDKTSVFLAYTRVNQGGKRARIYSSYLPAPTRQYAYLAWAAYDDGYQVLCQMLPQGDGQYSCEADLPITNIDLTPSFFVTEQPVDLQVPSRRVLVSNRT